MMFVGWVAYRCKEHYPTAPKVMIGGEYANNEQSCEKDNRQAG